jgi:glyoxylase-like metal-dependent hydrolase (beta-lactamase superfamily II)
MDTNSPYEVIQIDDTSYYIQEKGVRCFLFVGTEKALLVDTGLGSGDLRAVVENITKLPIMLVNTHADRDHIGGNKYFDEAYMHPSEFAMFHDGEGKELAAKALWEGEIINIGNRTFEVILTPGHTQGNISLLDKENKILIVGDSMSSAPIYIFGQHRNLYAYLESMKKLNAMKNDFDTIYGAHGDFPLKEIDITDFISAMEKIIAGEIEGVTPPWKTDAKLYDTGKAKFLYVKE